MSAVEQKNVFDDLAGYHSMVGYLPQKIGFYTHFTGYDMMKYMHYLKGGDRKNTRQIDELLQRVNLYDVKDNKIATYSGGMKQRLGIAQAFLESPRILLLDEPTVGLDLEERAEFKRMIQEAGKEMTVILSTHIVSDVEYIANEILIMKNGELIQHGSPEKLLKPIEKCVWECDVSRKEAEELELNYVTANLKHNNGAERLRIISQEAPCRTAWNVDPTLEDLYLYYFAEVSEHE